LPRIWDIHVHFPRNFQKPEEDPQEALDHMAEKLREVGTLRASLLCPETGRGPFRMPGMPLTYRSCIEMAQSHGDLFVPHAVVDPEVATYERIHELQEMGYRGLKMIGVRRPYDTRDYFPVYRAAEELGMPILFHLGVIGGGIDWLNRHPRRDPESAKRLREWEKPPEDGEVEGAMRRMRGGPRETSAANMRPFHLDTLANYFPKLKIIGAHMGGTGNYDEAASVARWRRWVYLDLSGGRTIERHSVERGLIGREVAIEKLIFGSDCPADEVHLHVDRFARIFDDLGLTEEEQDLIWYRNAAELFGEEEPWWAEE
jgi:predicted TIM-barrel fold metal-dependent hydrolase